MSSSDAAYETGGNEGLSRRVDEDLDAPPNRKRLAIFLILAGGWWVPDNAYVRYFVSLPFDAAGRCNCTDEALLQVAAVGGLGCCPVDPDMDNPKCVASDRTDFSELPASECSGRLDISGNPCQAPSKGGCASSVCVLCPRDGRICEEDHSTLARDFELFCEDTELIGMIGVWGSMLSPVGGFLGSGLSNRYGRKIVYSCGQLTFGIVLCLGSLCEGYASYSLTCALCGFTYSAATVPGFTMAAELCGPANRTKYSVRMWSYGWDVKTLLLAPFSYFVVVWLGLSWRYLQASCGLIVLLQATLIIAYVPESPRWLIDQGRYEEADAAVESLVGKRPDPTYSSMQPPKEIPKSRPEPITLASDMATAATHEIDRDAGEKLTFGDLFTLLKGPTILSLLGLCYLWFCASLSYYGIAFNSGNLSGDAYTDWVLASALPLFPSTYFGTRFIDQPRWGRTKGNAVMYGLVCVVMAFGAFFPSIATPMSMIGTVFANAVFNTMYLSVPELYPTRYNAPVLAACYASGVAGTSVGGYLPNAIGGASTLFFIFVCCLGCVPVSLLLLPETLNKPYPSGTMVPLPPWLAKNRETSDVLLGATTSAVAPPALEMQNT